MGQPLNFTGRTWTVGEVIKAPLGYRCIPIRDASGAIVADCEYQSDAPGHQAFAEKNASLIAAAPEMFQILGVIESMALDATTDNDKQRGLKLKGIITLAQVAIEKAKATQKEVAK